MGATLQAGPQGPGPSFSLAISLLWGEGRGTGISVTLAPHHCLIAGQHLHRLKLEHSTPGSPGLSTTATLPASDPQEATWHWVPPAPVFRCSWGVPSGGRAAVGEQLSVLGCHRCRVSAPGGPCRDTAPSPRCSGPGSVLGIPTLLPWTLPATPCPGMVPTDTDTGGMKGRDCPQLELPSGWLLVGISASQSPVSCPVPIPMHGLEVPGSVLFIRGVNTPV